MRETDYRHLKRNREKMIQHVKDHAAKFGSFMNTQEGLPDGWIKEFEKLQLVVNNMIEVDKFIKAHEAGEDPEWPEFLSDIAGDEKG